MEGEICPLDSVFIHLYFTVIPYIGTASVTPDVLLVNGMAFAFGALHLPLTACLSKTG